MSLRTLEEHILALANYLPNDRLFAGKGVVGSTTYQILKGTAYEMLTADGLIKAFRREIIPDLTIQFIAEWEKALGIPDDCFPGTGDLNERRSHVLIKLAFLGAQTTEDFQNVVDIFTTGFIITNGVDDREAIGFPMTFPLQIDNPISTEDRFTIVIKTSVALGPTFPITFPITFAVAQDAAIAECLVRKMAPANVRVIVREI